MNNNRNRRVEIAQETVEIINNGFYENSSGQRVEFQADKDYMLENTKLYRPNEFVLEKNVRDQELSIELSDETTFSAARRLVEKGIESCCLNFASAKNPGGGFLGGAQAQEECLARASALYESLNSKFEYYEINRNFKSCIYTDHMIYSPAVPVFRDDNDQLLETIYKTSVVTSPAINMGVIRSRESENIEKAFDAMTERMRKLLILCANEGEQNLVLGAWGCGVFQNDPEWIAKSFIKALKTTEFEGVFGTIVFAIPNTGRAGKGNYEAFKKIMEILK